MEYTPQNMQTVSQLPLGMLWGGLEQLKESKLRDEATLAATQQENIRKQQAHELAQKQGAATLAGTQITNDTNAFNLGQKRKTMDADTRAQLAKFGAEADEADWKSAVIKIKQGVSQGDQKALELYEMLPEIMEARKTAAAAAAKADQESKDRRYTADSSAASARYSADAATARATATAGAKMPTSPNALYARYQYLADNADTEEEKAQYKALADRELERIVQARLLAVQAGQAGKPNVGAMGDGNIPVNPMPQASDVLTPRKAPTVAPMYAKNPKTNERIMSEDGGKTWKPAK
jgi:hypothetical protein